MPIIVNDLNDLVAETVQSELAVLAGLMQEFNPSIDVRRGVLYDLLFKNAAMFGTKNLTEVDRLRRSQSLLAASEDPELAEDEIIDAIASNFRVTRKTGRTSSGPLTIIVSKLEPLVIASGAVFAANGRNYVTETSYAARTDAANVASDNDRVLTATADGEYAFTISVVSVDEDITTAVTKDTLFTPERPPINYVKSFAATDFLSGLAPETNADLLGRLLEGVASKALSGRSNMSASLLGQSAFENSVANSAIGFGDGEMLRDQHSIFPGSYGGRVDWYVRTERLAQRTGLVKTAVLQSKTADNRGVWQFSIGRDEAPGFFDTTRIVLKDSGAEGTYTVDSDVRDLDLTDLTDGTPVPDIVDTVEGVYSRFQTGTIQFTDTDTDTSALTVGVSTNDYDVTVRSLSQIADVQSWASRRGITPVAGDILVKAPIPCFLRISFSLRMEPGQATPDVGVVADAVTELVNTYGFTGVFPASAVSSVVHESLEGVAHIGAIDMLADIRRPDGTTRRLRSTEEIAVPAEPDRMVTGRTVGFFCSAEDVNIVVETANIPEI